MSTSYPTFANPIVAAGVGGLCDLYADRAVTPVEACETYLSRIVGLDNALNAYVFLDANGARAAAHASAERWRSGAALSRLDGVPVAVKANVAVKGWPWHAGIGAYRDRLAEEDAQVVTRLRAAGAVILGLNGMFEGAFGATGDNPWFGQVRNPWDFGHAPGGSSSGAGAAVAAGLCAAAVGTDTLGSVRLPAAFCGVTGHKPTPGLVETGGVVPMAWTLDTVGSLARSPQDAALLFAGLCAADAEVAADIAQPASPESLADTPLAVLETGVALSPHARAGLDAAVARARAAGLTVERLSLHGDLQEMLRQAAFVSAAESAAEHAQALADAPEGFSPAYLGLLKALGGGSAADLAQTYRALSRTGDAIREAISGYGAVLAPTTPTAPFPADGSQPIDVALLTALANVAGLPATAFPIGLDGQGAPLSAQAIGWDDETTLGLASLLTQYPGAPPAYRG